MMVSVFVFRSLLIGILLLGAGMGTTQARSPDADSVLVVYNENDPASKSLAQYYASRREIPAAHVVGLNCPMTEEISRSDYETTIAAPLRRLFERNNWWPITGSGGIRFAALIRGIPLKIAPVMEGIPAVPNQPAVIAARNEASVDSELTCLALEKVSPAGLMGNPYFRSVTPAREFESTPPILLVSRLDAPDEITVRAMIDDSLLVEKTGLWGWSYVDIRSIKDPGYKVGDDWMQAAAKSMWAKGLPVLMDRAPETFPAGFPLTNAAIYYGWYAANVCGPFADASFRFVPGAVAVHLHSFSATTLRSPTSGWCGPLVMHGAAASLGNCYEPTLMLTVQLDLFQDRLMSGLTLAESAWMATRCLSWMSVVVGDPLYRPYAIWSNPAALDGKTANVWQKYRNIIRANGGVLASEDQLTQAAQEYKNSLFLESLASAQLNEGLTSTALESLKTAASLEGNPFIRFRLAIEQMDILKYTGRLAAVDEMLRQQRGTAPGAPQQQLLQAIYLQLHPPTPSPSPKPTK